MAVVNIKKIEEIAAESRLSQKKLVMTNGCFDLLHIGHVESINFASTCGDVLIVAINSDVSVKRRKNRNRPIITQCERAKMVDSLKGVDYVVVFDNENELNDLYKTLLPDVLVKGEEYIGEKIAGAEYAKRVVFTPCFYSTTSIIERIKHG